MRRHWRSILFTAFFVVAAIAIAGYSRNEVQTRYDISNAIRATGGDPAQGKRKIPQYGCQTCHTIPGIAGANAKVGPPLNGFAYRVYIAGELANTPDNLKLWLQHPHNVEPKTAMPEMGVTEEDSRHIAAYLYTLR
jgi:cytochrome c2